MRGGKPKTPGLPGWIKLHGTGFSNVSGAKTGDLYEYEYDPHLVNFPDYRVYGQFVVEEVSGPDPHIRIRPTEHLNIPGQPLQSPDGPVVWGWYIGIEENGVLNPLSIVRFDLLIEFCIQTYQIDRKRVHLCGTSMGGIASLTYGLKNSHKFSAIHAEMPNWNYGAVGTLQPGFGPGGAYRRPKPLRNADGTDAWPAYDMHAYIANPNNKTRWLMWNVARSDPSMPWVQQVEAIRLCRLTRKAFAVGWNDGGHGEGGHAADALQQDYPHTMFATDKSHPAFFNSSIDHDPMGVLAPGERGYINIGFVWRNVTDFHDRWSCEVRNKRATGDMTVDVLPYNVQHFTTPVQPKRITVPLGQWVTVEFLAEDEPPVDIPPIDEDPPVDPPPPPATGTMAALVAAMKPGDWAQLPGTNMSAVYPPVNPAIRGSTGPGAVIVAWGGGAYDTKRNAFIFNGGGHGDYGGNEVYAFFLEEMRWERLTEPSPLNPPLPVTKQVTTADGTPISSAVRDGLEYLPNVDKVFRNGGAEWPIGNNLDPAPWLFDAGTKKWTKGSGGKKGKNCSAYDPVRGTVYVLGDNFCHEYDARTDTWSNLKALKVARLPATCALDPVNRKIIDGAPEAENAVAVLTLSATGMPSDRVSTPTTGDTAWNNLMRGLEYDPVRKRLVAWYGARETAYLDGATMAWKAHPNAASPDAPTLERDYKASGEIYGRWRYVPKYDVFIGYNNPSGNVWLWKPVSVDGVEEPPVEPPDEEEPVEPPASGTATVEVQRFTLNANRLLVLEDWTHGRYQRLKILKANTQLKFLCVRAADGGGVELLQAHYELWVDGNLHSSVEVAPGAKSGFLPLDRAALAHGDHKFLVKGHPEEDGAVTVMYIDHGQPFANESMYAVTTGYDMGKEPLLNKTTGKVTHVVAKITPAGFSPKKLPSVARECPPFSVVQSDGTLLPKSNLWRTDVIPAQGTSDYRPSRHKESGIISTFNRQAYDPEWAHKEPPLHYLDGPRGRGTIVSPTAMKIGRKGSCYAMDGPRFCTVDASTQYVHTLFGKRHKDIASQWEGGQDYEVVGAWPGIPYERQMPWECWQWVWWVKTLAVDLNAPQSEWVNGEPPHKENPVMFWPDAFNRLNRTEYDRKDRSIPPTTREIIPAGTLGDSWSVAMDENDVIYISERTLHRISKWSTDGEFLGVLIQGLDLAHLPAGRRVMVRKPGVTLQQARDGFCGPEDLHYMGNRTLRVCSGAMAQFLDINADTGVISNRVNLKDIESKSGFGKMAVSDGVTFISHWALTNNGMARAYLPDGREWDYTLGAELGYPSSAAVDFNLGRIYLGSSDYGLVMISLKLPTDVRDAARYSAGKREFESMGGHISHPPWWDASLPEGLSENALYYLAEKEHGS